MPDPESSSPAGYVAEDGTKRYYTSALSDAATWTLEELRMLHAGRLCGAKGLQYADVEACSACAEHRDDETRDATLKHHFSQVAWFYQAFKEQFKRDFNSCPINVWADLHRRGMEELRDLGIVEDLSKDTTTQLWYPKRVWFSRVVPSVFELKEG